MVIWHISDTHGLHSLLNPPPYDVVVFSGDCSNWQDIPRNTNEVMDFLDWFSVLKGKKVFCGGNHDTSIYHGAISKEEFSRRDIIYLENSSIEIDGIKFWGSPHTLTFGRGWAWNTDPDKISAIWDLIPTNTDVIVSHGPPRGISDLTYNFDKTLSMCGDTHLLDKCLEIKPSAVLFGHIHNYNDIINSKISIYDGIMFSNGAVAAMPKNLVGSNGNTLRV
jgi:predicted phosphohydrolase